MRVSTSLNIKDYKKFKQKAEKLNITPYKLAQTAIITFIEEPNAEEKTTVQKIKDFLETLP